MTQIDLYIIRRLTRFLRQMRNKFQNNILRFSIQLEVQRRK